MYEPKLAAKTLLLEASKSGISITNLKIQKLLYLAHGLLLARTDSALVSETFQAWKYGPVIESLYHQLKVFGPDAISANDTFVKYWSPLPEFATDANKAISDVLAQFGNLSSRALVNLSHDPNGPWQLAYTATTASSEISEASIKEYFKQHLAGV
jgi:uncharacterized phage-associated protein